MAGYNVQRMDAERTWVDVSVGTTATQVDLDGGTNGRDRIRVQAVDAAGNASAWVDSKLLLVASVTKYYALGGQSVAVQRGGELSYLTGDHLGSTTLVTDTDGNELAQSRYYPFGGERWSSAALPTDKTFTGQRSEGFGLLDYGARYYDPYLSQFASPDSMVPNPGNPLDWNRYSYTRYNPIRYSDPTGHRVDDGCRTEGCSALPGEEDRDIIMNVIHNNNERQENTENVENIENAIEIGASILVEPIDWMFTARDCLQGECSLLVLLGLLPIIPGSKIDDIVDAVKKMDGMKLPINDALDLATMFLGKDYIDMGNGRFISADGLRQVRMGNNDVLGFHGGGPHINFDILGPNPAKPGFFTQIFPSIHIYLDGR